MVLNMPIVNIASIINSCWKYVKKNINMNNMQNMHNNVQKHKYAQNYEYVEYVIIKCIYPGFLHTAKRLPPSAVNATS